MAGEIDPRPRQRKMGGIEKWRKRAEECMQLHQSCFVTRTWAHARYVLLLAFFPCPFPNLVLERGNVSSREPDLLPLWNNERADSVARWSLLYNVS
jgi:hypothetical protein